MTDRDEAQRCLLGVDLGPGSSSALFVINSVVIQKNSFSVPVLYEFHCTSIEDVPETLGDRSRSRFCVRDSQAMKAFGKTQPVLSKITFQQSRNEAEGQSADEMEILQVPVTDTVEAMFVENGTAGIFRVFNLGDYHQVHSFVRKEEIQNLETPLRHDDLSHVTF